MEQEDWSKLDAHAKLAVYRHQYQISKDAAGEMARFRAEAQQKNAQITMLRAQVDSLHTQIAHSNENTPRQTRRNGEAASIPRSPAMGTCAGTEDRARARAEAQQKDTEIATLRARVESLQSQMAPSAAAAGPAGRGASGGDNGAPASAYDHIKRWSLSPSLLPPATPSSPFPLPFLCMHCILNDDWGVSSFFSPMWQAVSSASESAGIITW